MHPEKEKKRIHRCAFPLITHGISDRGLVRRNNQDVFLTLKDYAFFALADGMGGHKAGEVAAKVAVDFVSASIAELFQNVEKEWSVFDLSYFNKLSIENANSRVHYMGQKQRECAGMGTTLCTLLFYERSLIYSHVGDSRIYRFREGSLTPLTLDHSLANQIVKTKRLSKEKLRTHPSKNVLTRAVGPRTEVEVDIHIAPVNEHDVYLMCSDGLTNHVSDEEISTILKKSAPIKEKTEQLIERAKEEGGRDNVTVVLIQTQEPHEQQGHLSR